MSDYFSADALSHAQHESSRGVFGPSVIPTGLLAQCAESKVWTCTFGGKDAVLKHRFAKAYRHKSLDVKLRVQRTQREAKALVRAKKLNVTTPNVYHVDKSNCTIIMELIKGKAVRDVISEAADKIPQEILRTRANDVFLRTVKVEEAEEEGGEALPTVVAAVNVSAAAAAGVSSGGGPAAPPGSTHLLTHHGVSTGTSSHHMNHFAVTQAPPTAAQIVAASGLQLSAAEAEAAVANLEALDSLGKILLTKMGAVIGSLHNGDIIHGDLTTANFLMRTPGTEPSFASSSGDAAATAEGSVGVANSNGNSPSSSSSPSTMANTLHVVDTKKGKDQKGNNTSSSSPFSSSPISPNNNSSTAKTVGELVLIDFGLVRDSTNAEERAVDLYVLQRAIASAHPYLTLVLETLLVGYAMTVDAARGKGTLERLVAVRARGRKRSMIG